MGNPVMQRGVILRHLVMPGQTAEAAEIMKFVAESVSRDTYVNVMEQYRQGCGVEIYYSVVHRKLTVLLSTSLAWLAWDGCSRAELFPQLATNLLARPRPCT